MLLQNKNAVTYRAGGAIGSAGGVRLFGRSLRAILAGQDVSVHAVFRGPVDTDMNRGFDIPKASPEAAAKGIFDGLEKKDEDVFPDPAAQFVAEGWRNGVAKGLQREFAAFVSGSAS